MSAKERFYAETVRAADNQLLERITLSAAVEHFITEDPVGQFLWSRARERVARIHAELMTATREQAREIVDQRHHELTLCQWLIDELDKAIKGGDSAAISRMSHHKTQSAR